MSTKVYKSSLLVGLMCRPYLVVCVAGLSVVGHGVVSAMGSGSVGMSRGGDVLISMRGDDTSGGGGGVFFGVGHGFKKRLFLLYWPPSWVSTIIDRGVLLEAMMVAGFQLSP